MKIFRICGYGSGRGELLSLLAGEFSFRQIEFAVIKHAHKPFDMDKPGSETSNLREAGCRQTLIANRDRWGLLCDMPGQAEPDPVLLAEHLADCDLVLAIGFDHAPLPGLEVLRGDHPNEPLYRRDPHIRTVVIDGPPPAGVPFSFAHGDVETIATHILDRAAPLSESNSDRVLAAH